VYTSILGGRAGGVPFGGTVGVKIDKEKGSVFVVLVCVSELESSCLLGIGDTDW